MNFSIRKIFLLLVGMSGILMMLSGLILLLSPPEDVILWKGWRSMGMGYNAWLNVFLISSFLFFLSAFTALILHANRVIDFIKSLSPMELAAGISIPALILAGTYANISSITYPVRTLNRWKSSQSAAIPVKGLQSMSVEELCSMGGINAACCLSLLTEKGFKIKELDMSLRSLVKGSGKSIEEVVEILKPHMEDRFRERFGGTK